MASARGKRPKTKSKMKVFCQVDGCQVTLCGNNMKNHYKKNTYWEILAKLKAAVGNAQEDRLLSTADKHTSTCSGENTQ